TEEVALAHPELANPDPQRQGNRQKLERRSLSFSGPPRRASSQRRRGGEKGIVSRGGGGSRSKGNSQARERPASMNVLETFDPAVALAWQEPLRRDPEGDGSATDEGGGAVADKAEAG
ncbi:unnamed protein product, partial [Discosporangium mesarthrocarpum]